MEGRREEQLAKKRKGRSGRARETAAVAASTPSAPSFGNAPMTDVNGQAFVVDSSTGRAYFLNPGSVSSAASSTAYSPVPSPAPEESSALSVDAEPAWLADVAAPADGLEYASLLALGGPDTASVDWRSLSRTSATPEAYAVAPVISSTRRVATAGTEAFIFDSGASTHLSPCKADFQELIPIAPRGIRGVNGSVIYAHGIGKVRLHIGRGNNLVLDSVLYVPLATVRLLSISALCRSPARLSVAFDSTSVRILRPNGSLVASGSLSSRRLYSLDGTPPSIDHAFFASRSPTYDTWHRRLGHVNHRTVWDMSRSGAVTGMHLPPSPAPSKCEHCVRGKQTHSAVPKVRSGVRASRPLGRVFVDMAGPHDVRSAAGNLYTINFVDD